MLGTGAAIETHWRQLENAAYLCCVVNIASCRIAQGLEVHQGGWNGICYFPHASNTFNHRDLGQRGCR